MTTEKRGIQAHVTINVFAELSDQLFPITLENARAVGVMVADAKQAALREIRKKAKEITMEDITFREVMVPNVEDLT